MGAKKCCLVVHQRNYVNCFGATVVKHKIWYTGKTHCIISYAGKLTREGTPNFLPATQQTCCIEMHILIFSQCLYTEVCVHKLKHK